MSTASLAGAVAHAHRSLNDLAPETKSYFCQFLPVSDLKSLALTSSAWYAHAEPQLWASIDIYPVRYRTSLAGDAAEGRLRVSLLSALEGRPSRVKFVRRLTIGTKVIEAEATDRLLRLLAPTLHTLRLQHRSCGLRTTGLPCADVSWGTFSLAGMRFDRLLELEWAVSDDRASEHRTVLRSMPVLERLTLCGVGSWIRQTPSGPEDAVGRAIAEEVRDGAERRTSTRLKFFSTQVAGAGIGLRICREVLERSPQLESLELACQAVEVPDTYDDDDEDEDEDEDEDVVDEHKVNRQGVVAAVASMMRVKALYVWYRCRTWEEAWVDAKSADEIPFGSVEWLMIPRKWDEDLVPPLSSLITLIAVVHQSLVPLACACRPSRSHTGRLEEWFIEQLDRAPLLTELAVYDGHERLIMPESQWRDVGCFGFIIRTYVGPYGTFYHFRCQLSSEAEREYSAPPDDGHNWIAGTDRDPWAGQDGWVDVTLYQDRELPYEVLSKVYETEGMEVEFEQGGRDMTLGDPAWKILEGWRKDLSESEWA